MSWFSKKETNAQKTARGLVKFQKVTTEYTGYGDTIDKIENVWGTPQEAAAENSAYHARKKLETRAVIKSIIERNKASINMLSKEKQELEYKISDAGIEELKRKTLAEINTINDRIKQFEENNINKQKELNQSGGKKTRRKNK